MKNIVDFFINAKKNFQSPFLIEFSDEKKISACGINPKCTLEVKNNSLYKNGVYEGHALKIFDFLNIEKGNSFFPAWLGFFSYDFHHYFYNTLPKKKESCIPDAFFQLFSEGEVFHTQAEDNNNKFQFAAKEITGGIAKKDFFSQIAKVQNLIKQGDVYQVNLSAPFYFDCSDSELVDIYAALRSRVKNPFSALLLHDDWGILSASPEKLFSLNEQIIKTKPIAGTKKRSLSLTEEQKTIHELLSCPKENAEHVMLVDLLRNDLNKICKKNTVQVIKDRNVEFFSHVMHLVSEVEGKTNKSLQEIFKAIFPGGTITGTPKINAIKAINEMEESKRGPYTGSLGYISSGFGSCFNILIRSVYKEKNKARINAGAGIVIDSVQEKEWAEVHKKAQGVMDILKNKHYSSSVRENIFGKSVLFQPSNQLKGNIAFIENKDSFSFNIVSLLKSFGVKVKVLNVEDVLDESFSHVVLGPGPGNPEKLPLLMRHIKEAVRLNKPLLGICLGHQAIGHFFGAQITQAKPVHGQIDTIIHQNQGIFKNLCNPALFTRYHSLIVNKAPKDFFVDAATKDNIIMALRHKTKPIFGVQFHPESYLSVAGEKLFENFLRY